MSLSLNAHVIVDPSLIPDPFALSALLAKLADFEPVLTDIGSLIEQGLEEAFDSQGHGVWPSLARATIIEKYRLGYDATTEVRTGLLFRALVQRGSPGHKFVVTENSLTVGVLGDMVPYAHIQAVGSKRNLPARIMIQITPQTMEKIISTLVDWLGGGDAVTIVID